MVAADNGGSGPRHEPKVLVDTSSSEVVRQMVELLGIESTKLKLYTMHNESLI